MLNPVSTASSSWTASDSFSFHLSLARYTEFKNQTLTITHSYLDNRDIQIIEALEAKYAVDLASAYPNTVPKPDYATYLEYDNEGSIEKNCRRLLALLCDLQQTTGGKYTMRQLNNKHINTRSRLTAPFISLHDYGYFIRNQKPRGPRPTPEQIANMRITAIRRTNVDPKNTTAIKALYKYLTQRRLFWCELTQTVAVVRESEDSTKCMDDSSEADRWMRAMITVHGKQMVDYLDCCVDKLINSYIADLIADNKLDQLSAATTVECMTLTERVSVFHMIIRNLNAMCKGKSKSKYVPEPTTHRLSAETRPKSASARPIKRVFSDIDEHGSSSEFSPQLGIKRAHTFSTASFLGTPVLPDVSLFGNQNDKPNASIINGYPTPTLSATIAELQKTPQLSFAKSNPLQSQCVPSAATGLFMSVDKSHTDILTTSDPASKGIQSLGLFEWIDEMSSIANGTLLS